MTRTAALIPAAGRGRRAGANVNKLLLPLDAQPVILHTVRALHDHPAIDAVHVLIAPSDRPEMDRVFRDRERWPKLGPWIEGGEERQDSVRNGLAALQAQPPEWVIVHDGARPFLSARLVDRVVSALRQHAGAAPVVAITDTVRRVVDGRGEVLDRGSLVRVQTPQGFHWNVLVEAHRRAAGSGLRGTDDAQLVEALGLPIAWVDGEMRNLKLTSGPDFQLGAWLIVHPEWGG